MLLFENIVATYTNEYEKFLTTDIDSMIDTKKYINEDAFEW